MSDSYQPFYRRRLPHYQPPGATLFVTFRLAGTLPQTLVEDFRRERAQLETLLDSLPDENACWRAVLEQRRREFRRYEVVLDRSDRGPDWLRRPEIADLVMESLHYRNGVVYTLDAFCIMSNHVHLVCTPLADASGIPFPLHKIMQSLKSYTARHANEVLGRAGAFWQEENFDHVVRDGAELGRTIRYVMNNPVKAGLVVEASAWPWTFVRTE